ncbi:TetR family transcriptional regulator, partial [Mycobacterium tuberculosis]|nr:TetR family transcriptional regulator [Mycobacterium tuberculosis]
MQAEITAIALRLFRERGYSETTVDDLAAASGMSRRTFFRYFPSKEDVISGKWVGMGEDMIARLLARPGDEDPWTSVRA